GREDPWVARRAVEQLPRRSFQSAGDGVAVTGVGRQGRAELGARADRGSRRMERGQLEAQRPAAAGGGLADHPDTGTVPLLLPLCSLAHYMEAIIEGLPRDLDALAGHDQRRDAGASGADAPLPRRRRARRERRLEERA